MERLPRAWPERLSPIGRVIVRDDTNFSGATMFGALVAIVLGSALVYAFAKCKFRNNGDARARDPNACNALPDFPSCFSMDAISVSARKT